MKPHNNHSNVPTMGDIKLTFEINESCNLGGIVMFRKKKKKTFSNLYYTI